MTTYNTGNPLGSTAVKDIYDNAESLDYRLNGPLFSYLDRLGVPRKSWAGIIEDFQQFLLNSGYEFIGDYDSGPLNITARNQIFVKDGEFWRASASLALPYTTIENWATDQDKFVSVGDAVLRQDLSTGTGATLIGRGEGTVESALSAIEAETNKGFNSVNGNIVSGGFAPVRCANILGDSISYGANAQNIQRDSWVGILGKMLNIEFGTQNLGWLNVIASTSNGDGTYLNYHTQTGQTGIWVGVAGASAGHTPAGYALESSVAASTLVYKVPISQRYLRVWYDGTVTGTIEILINSVVVQTLTTTGAGTGYERGAALELAALTATKNGIASYTVRCASGTVRILGFEFANDSVGNFRLNNFSRDGRAGRYVSQDVINKACAGCYFMVWALGTNDVPGGATAITEYTQRIDWLIAAAAANKTRVVLVDFMYDQVESHGLREQLRRANREIPGSVLIDAGKAWAVDGVQLNLAERTARNLAAGVHPEEPGHRIIAEVVAQRLGLSVTSKRDAVRRDPTWHALDLSGGSALNSFNLPGQFVGYRIGERAIEVVGFLSSVPASAVTLGTIPATLLPGSGFNSLNFKSNPDNSGNTGQLTLLSNGTLSYTPVGTPPLFVGFYLNHPFNDTATWP